MFLKIVAKIVHQEISISVRRGALCEKGHNVLKRKKRDRTIFLIQRLFL